MPAFIQPNAQQFLRRGEESGLPALLIQSNVLFRPNEQRCSVKLTRLMSISSGEGTHVKELMRRTRLFLDGVEAEEAEKERLEMLRKAAMGGTGGTGEDEGKQRRR